jgi:hypothetical protein
MWQKQKLKEIKNLIENEKDSISLNILKMVESSIQKDILNEKETTISPFLLD